MLPSSRFGFFVLHERLAVGGMGELFLASHVERPDRPLALKILLKEFRDRPDFVTMFRDEARIGMHLAHKNIVGVHEIGEIDRIPYILMEYVHGENLRAVLRALYMRRELFPPELAVKLGVEVLEGLDHAHRARDESGQKLRLVHRDLSPDNILLSYDGEVKILDFGIAKATGRSTETQFGVLKGKAQYMPPEQAHGRSVDGRSDLFALGVVLLETLVGAKRFTTEDQMQQYTEARNWEPYGPSDRVEGLPAALDGILVKAMQADPPRRWQNADDFAAALTRLQRSGTLPPTKETLASILRRLFPEKALQLAAAVPATLPVTEPDPEPARRVKGRSIAVETRVDPDLSAPPRWASDDDDDDGEGVTSRAAADLAAMQTTTTAIPSPRPTRTEAIPKNLADESGQMASRPGAVPAEGWEGAETAAGIFAPAPQMDHRDEPFPFRAQREGLRGETEPIRALLPPAVVRPVRVASQRTGTAAGELFPDKRKPRSRLPGMVALALAVGLVGATAWAAIQHFRHVDPVLTVSRADTPVLPVTFPTATQPTSTPQTPAPTATATPTPPPAVVKKAMVRLLSKPTRAVVWVDGVKTSRKTPTTVSLAPGAHTLQVAAPGYRPWNWSEKVRSGDSLQLHADLRPK